ncbi:uncharacterized protein Z518_08446 [Rhinocladiella mackenziei CBS 650.93]|uniref:HAUS augmin-like complex subunit 6 N-terminal domain-containing protein n=1 Tax=Rhinocladiella mackenziei CBS 650.93 TaxID=1442369 RepID=A0A0D2J0X9_9EURO|nr:uncharacterized protein Z518_08446 [Rhinocladiella mackenziei CBS 650.93]KIX02505.1 hypothetical protein Z518_08446 [Rhinocladiella mackenziei CBS 650.93]
MDRFSSHPPWRPRSHIMTFIKTLHLLNLDLLPDFPRISESTFRTATSSKCAPSTSTPMIQNRVKSVEWALYRLFELYDLEETRSKLSPHFPPTAPIQSLNLRAALYKALMELKKNGILPRDTVLRKTMLDECKGDKFEELLSAFAMVVLRQRIASPITGKTKQRGTEKSIVAQMTDSKPQAFWKEQDAENMVPLILAHRVSLQQSLRHRQKIREKATACISHLEAKQRDISRRLQIASQPEDDIEDMPPQTYEALREQVNHAFAAADRRWATYIFDGNPSDSNSMSVPNVPKWPFDEPEPDQSVHEFGDPTGGTGVNELMKQLKARISMHHDRAAKLKQLRDALRAEIEGQEQGQEHLVLPPKDASRTNTTITTDPATDGLKMRQFNKHQTLTLQSLA